jgi:hypothetical protein
MKQLKLISLTILTLIVGFSFGQTNNDTPFDTIDFSTGKWLLVFNEIEHYENWTNDNNTMDETIQIIDNGQTIDSLKKQFKCDLKKMIDGQHEFVITIYKDGKEFKQYVWDNPENFSFGSLQEHFQKASNQSFETNSLSKFNKKISKWSKKGQYIITHRHYFKPKPTEYYVKSYKKE